MKFLLHKINTDRLEQPLKYAAWLIVLIGVLLRVVVFCQANSMYIDEANVALNIYGRSFAGLLQPLDNYQYAPPVFLWVVKLSVLAGGYSEYAYRLFPLVCGIAALPVMYYVLKHYTPAAGMWYPLLIVAAGPIYVHYSCVTKQYVPDMLIALLLIWMALRYKLENNKPVKLFVIWLVAGSVAVWTSMPAVFVLAAVGVYYMAGIIKLRQYGKAWFIVAAAALWLLQFGAYYLLILKSQANSRYLQNFHQAYFLYWPGDLKTLKADVNVFVDFFSNMAGHQALSLVFHALCMAIGIGYLYKGSRQKLLLLVVPLLLVFVAAALHQYSTIQRLMLFVMPMVLILIGVGIYRLTELRYTVMPAAILVVGLICFANFNALKHLVVPFEREEMKQSLTALAQRGVDGSRLYIDHLAVPPYKYYTTVHPAKGKWVQLQGARVVDYETNVDSLAQTFEPGAAMLYGWQEPHIVAAQQSTIGKYRTTKDSFGVKGGKGFIYN